MLITEDILQVDGGDRDDATAAGGIAGMGFVGGYGHAIRGAIWVGRLGLWAGPLGALVSLGIGAGVGCGLYSIGI